MSKSFTIDQGIYQGLPAKYPDYAMIVIIINIHIQEL